MSEEAVGWRSMGKGATYQERIGKRLPCLDCRMELMTGSMIAHRRRLHGTDQAIDCERLPVSHMEHLPQVLEVSFTRVTNKWQSHLPGRPGSSRIWSVLRKKYEQEVMEGQSDDPGVTPLTFTPMLVMRTPGNRLYSNQPELHHRTVPAQRVTTAEMRDIATLFLGE